MASEICRGCGARFDAVDEDLCPACAAAEPTRVEREGPRIPGFTILGALGAGGMGRVYRAREEALGRDVALKVLSPELSGTPEFVERFRREARTLARLDHPGIVRLHRCGDEGGTCWMVMELVDGTDLRRVLDRGRLGTGEALAIARSVCEGLEYAHGQGVVHRDIKPSNVLFDREGRVRIADFGIAKLAGDGGTEALTGSLHVLGTPHYMAPEQVERSKSVDHRADLYSFGVLCYEMLTGQLPIGRFAAPSRVAPVDPRLDDVVLTCLERDPDRRYARASDVRRALEAIEADASTDSTELVSAGEGEAPTRRSPRLAARAGLLAALLAAATVLLIPPGSRPLPPSWREALAGSDLQVGPDFTLGIEFVYAVDPEETERAAGVIARRCRDAGLIDPLVEASAPGRVRIVAPFVEDERFEEIERLVATTGSIEFRLAAPRDVEETEWEAFRGLAWAGEEDPARRAYESDLAAQGRLEGEVRRGYAWFPTDEPDAERSHRLIALWEERDEPGATRREYRIFGSGDLDRVFLETIPELRPAFEMKAAVRGEFRTFTGEHSGHGLAILLGGRVATAPRIEGALDGAGIIPGLGGEQARLLVQAFRSGELRSRPRLVEEGFSGPRQDFSIAWFAFLAIGAVVLATSVASFRSDGVRALGVPASAVLHAVLLGSLLAARGTSFSAGMLAALPLAAAVHLHAPLRAVGRRGEPRVPGLLAGLAAVALIALALGEIASGPARSAGVLVALSALASAIVHGLGTRTFLERLDASPRVIPGRPLSNRLRLGSAGVLIAISVALFWRLEPLAGPWPFPVALVVFPAAVLPPAVAEWRARSRARR